MIYPLENVVANATGTASVTSTVDGVASIPASRWHVNVHNGPALTPPDPFSPIACGEVKGGSNEVTVPLQQGFGLAVAGRIRHSGLGIDGGAERGAARSRS